jgi:hypothetical protein
MPRSKAKSANSVGQVIRQVGRLALPVVEEMGRDLVQETIGTLSKRKGKEKSKKLRARQAPPRSRERSMSAALATSTVASGSTIHEGRTKGDVTMFDGSVLVGHLVLLADFASDSVRINPTNARLFPQLAEVGKLFTEYRFESLNFVFTNPGLPTTREGQFVAGISYDSDAVNPDSIEVIFNRDDSVKGPLWLARTVLKCTQLPKSWNLISNDLAPGSRRGVDIGWLLLGTTPLSGSAVDNASEITVEYRVSLRGRRPDPTLSGPTCKSAVVLMGETNGSYATGVTTYPTWMSPLPGPFEVLHEDFTTVPLAGFYLPKAQWKLSFNMRFNFTVAPLIDYSIAIVIRRNNVVGSIVSTHNFPYPAGTTAGNITGFSIVSSEGYSLPPDADDANSVFALSVLQASGQSMLLYGYTDQYRRVLMAEEL